MSEPAWDELLAKIALRYSELGPSLSRRASFLRHVQNLATWGNDPMDYPDPEVEFPIEVTVAYAVCHPDCGVQELIVEGSTQECQRCGRLLFRVESQKYLLAATSTD